jgi:hypothetical protein
MSFTESPTALLTCSKGKYTWFTMDKLARAGGTSWMYRATKSSISIENRNNSQPK